MIPKFISSIFFLLLCSPLFAQKPSFHLLKFGVKGLGGVTSANHLNRLTENWLQNTAEASNIELLGEEVNQLPFNIEVGYQPFFITRPVRLLQIGVKMDHSFSRMSAKFSNGFTNQGYELNINSESYIPGAFAYLTLGKLELGAGMIYAHTSVNINDDFFGYQDTWYGKNRGYEVSLGFSTNQEKNGWIHDERQVPRLDHQGIQG